MLECTQREEGEEGIFSWFGQRGRGQAWALTVSSLQGCEVRGRAHGQHPAKVGFARNPLHLNAENVFCGGAGGEQEVRDPPLFSPPPG